MHGRECVRLFIGEDKNGQEHVSKWKLGLNGISLNCGQAEEIAIADKLGYDYLEMRQWKLETFLRKQSVEKLHALFGEARVKPLSINAIEPICVGPGENQQQFAQRVRAMLQIAGTIGCECVVVNAYGIAPDIAPQQGKRMMIDGLKAASDIAAEYNVQLAYELLNRQYPVHTITDTMEVLEAVDRENVGWLLDFHFFHVAYPSLEALEKAGADRLLVVHMNDLPHSPVADLAVGQATRVLPGDGQVAIPALLATLCRMGYTRPFSVEVFDRKFMDWDPVEFATTAKQKMLTLLNEHYR